MAGDDGREVIDTIPAPDNTQSEAENTLFVQEALSLLTLLQKKVILATVLDGLTEKEVAERLGMSQPTIHRIKKRALKRLKKNILSDITRLN